MALDFETANFGGESACALSLVRVEGGGIVGEKSFLIKPPSKIFRFTHIHGLRWCDVENSPTFADCFPEISAFLEGAHFLAAHNAPFDRAVLRACCDYWDLETPNIPFLCTLKGSRRNLRLPKNSLDIVCRHLKIPLRHHDASSDARAAALIYLHMRSLGIDLSDLRIKN